MLKNPNQGTLPPTVQAFDSASSSKAIENLKSLNFKNNQIMSVEQIQDIAGKAFDVNNPTANGRVNGSQAAHDLLRDNYIKDFIERVNYASKSLDIHKMADQIRYAIMKNGKDVETRLMAEEAQKPGDTLLQTKIANTSKQVNSMKEYFDAHVKAAPGI